MSQNDTRGSSRAEPAPLAARGGRAARGGSGLRINSLGAMAFLATVAAWLSGARFVVDAADGASFGMAIATGVALLGYVVIVFLPGLTEGPDR
jgi:hypothetical protein